MIQFLKLGKSHCCIELTDPVIGSDDGMVVCTPVRASQMVMAMVGKLITQVIDLNIFLIEPIGSICNRFLIIINIIFNTTYSLCVFYLNNLWILFRTSCFIIFIN